MVRTIIVDIYNIEWEYLDDCDWFCDNCNASLNAQDGFYTECGTWKCEKCGHENLIAASEVRGPQLPSAVNDVSFMCEESDLEREISDYLYTEYGRLPSDFGYSIRGGDEEPDDDLKLADFCHGGDVFGH